MKYLLILLALLSASLQAEELVRAVSFAEEPLTITAVTGEPLQLLIELDDPGVTLPVYALQGMVRYDGVEGDGFLQMDNHFGAMGTFFTKSLAAAGPLGKLSGSSDWRPFVLPFYANTGDQADGASPLPEKLTLSLYLPGSGSVSIGEVGLYQYASGEDPLGLSGQWFGNRSAGLLGGIGGGLIGLWGALIGILASRGKARRFVLASANALFVIGIASLVGGMVALATAQPYAVYYPLLLIGIILAVVFGKMRGSLSARYEQLELQKMQSMDI
ncbi:MAG: hypothetical protein OEU90_08190 [Gammaproteobacteria bacterium]|nr:hypothetical protein [Gammaproteobacteria bacterium]MDH3749803.1 hypothetical protein [Gammaproteobacteria bacterium]MDH3805436.1 hypothetical protein [Gammaproteobacteria bacterium]